MPDGQSCTSVDRRRGRRPGGNNETNRYKSENVDSDGYLSTVIRYIHQNPVKAGMVRSCTDWKWSSCAAYYDNSCYPTGLLTSDLVLGIFSEDKDKAIKRFKEFNKADNEDKCLEYTIKARLTDQDAKQEIKKLNLEYNLAEIKALPKIKRDEIIKKITGIKGLSQRQAARLLGISPNLIFKA